MNSEAVARTRTVLREAATSADAVDLTWMDPPPPDEGWTMAPDALRFLTATVRHLRPRHILEFGAGVSTRVLSAACETWRVDCALSSVDHDPEFGCAGSRTHDGRGPSRCHAVCQVAPLVAREYCGRWVPVYLLARERLASPEPADLIVIDAPPTVLGGREGVFYQALAFSRPGTLMLLDDAARSEEKAALSRWQQNLGEAIEVVELTNFKRGLAAVIVKDAVPEGDPLTNRLERSRRELEALVGPDHTIVVGADEWWRDDVCANRTSVGLIGQHAGPPPDDATAIADLERLRNSGASFFVIGWPAFWWLDHYPGLSEYLGTRAEQVVRNDRLVVYRLS